MLRDGTVFHWLPCRLIIHESSAKRPMDSCPITDPALDVRNGADAVIWEGRTFVCDAWGWVLFVVSGHASHQHDGCEGPGRNIHLGAAMHAALKCLGMQVHLEVTK
ncbi:surface protease GP63 [Trypanosoma cruzi]|nr:surface protease GP63 [Trypanosoma cruzi]